MKMRWLLVKMLILFLLVNTYLAIDAIAAKRIVVLYAAASPILKELGLDHEVVGVTRNDHVFPHAVSVGSHLRPNVELIKALKPDLLIAGSRRAFPKRLEGMLNTEIFFYDPRSLKEILQKIEALGKKLSREKEAAALVTRLKAELSQIRSLSCCPRVIYEVSERPLKVAGEKSIVTSIIQAAGGKNLITVNRKHVLISPEEIIFLKPDIYIYQVGPMNKNPMPPKKRPYFAKLKSKIEQVEEFEFARPGINAFSAVIKLNRIFEKFCKNQDLN